MIQFDNIKKAYGSNIVLSIENLKITKGECIGLVGNNGAGKTTLLSLLLDLIEATEGTIRSKGQHIINSDEWKKYTGSFLNDGFLIPFLTPIEYFEFIGGLHGKNSSDVMEFLNENQSFYTDDILAKKYIRELSAGNKNKIGILAALLINPEILLLDEPFANLDPSSQSWLKSKLIKLNQNGITAIISSHDLNHVTEVCSRILLLEDGIIVKDKDNTEQMLDELESYFTLV